MPGTHKIQGRPAGGRIQPAATVTRVADDDVQKRWLEMTDALRQRWRKLTIDDVAYPYGSSAYLVRVLQERYGIDSGEALLQVREFRRDLARAAANQGTLMGSQPHPCRQAMTEDRRQPDQR